MPTRTAPLPAQRRINGTGRDSRATYKHAVCCVIMMKARTEPAACRRAWVPKSALARSLATKLSAVQIIRVSVDRRRGRAYAHARTRARGRARSPGESPQGVVTRYERALSIYVFYPPISLLSRSPLSPAPRTHAHRAAL